MCQMYEGSLPTPHWDSAENCQLISTTNQGEERLCKHLSCFLIGHWGGKPAIVCYTALLFANTRRKHTPHVCDMYVHLTPSRHHRYIFTQFIGKYLSYLPTLETLHFQHDFCHCPREHCFRHSILSVAWSREAGLLKGAEESST